VHRAGGEHLRDLGHLDHRRARSEQLGEARGKRAVGAHLLPLEVAQRLQRLLGVDALAGPGDRIQQPHAAALQLLLEHRLLRLVELPRGVVARGHEGHVVGREHRVFVAKLPEQDFADVHLAGRHRAQDVRMLDERAVGVHHDL
jgi:hypothetical protein